MTARTGLILVATFVAAVAVPSLARQAASTQTAAERTEIFVCGNDLSLPNPITPSAAALILAGDSRLFVPCPTGPHGADHREIREAALIASASLATARNTPEMLWRAAQARVRTRPPVGYNPEIAKETELRDLALLGAVQPGCSARVQITNRSSEAIAARAKRWRPGLVFQLMRSRDAAVRMEAAYGLGLQMAEAPADLIEPATEELRACIEFESNLEVKSLLLEAVGVARYTTDPQREAAEALLVEQSRDFRLMLGALTGLESLVRRTPRRPVADATRARLREIITSGVKTPVAFVEDSPFRAQRLALMVLTTVADFDVPVMRAVAQSEDWQLRRLLALHVDLSQLEHANVTARFAQDKYHQVRLEYVAALGRLATKGFKCDALMPYFDDEAPVVAMRAMDAVQSQCTDLEQVLPPIREWADKLGRAGEKDWHVPARALRTLARVRPEDGRMRLANATRHSVWQVRAAAAGVARLLADPATARTLASDPVANVQTAALLALTGLKSPEVFDAAISAMKNGSDYALLLQAALSLRGSPQDRRDEISNALLATLRRLTEEETDTSRDPRVAMLDRLGETLRPERSADLLTYLADYDDEVVAAAGRAFQGLVSAPPPAPSRKRRYPYQPPAEALDRLPTEAQIQLEEGIVTLRLVPSAAPVTVARFAQLAQQGFYNNRTFHRVEPNFVVQGGSAGANEYVGTSRFMRDEVGHQGRHIYGAVGISTRGRDTGDGQIFVDLVDLPRLDRQYTVFAYVTRGMNFFDNMLEGAKIVSVTVR